MASTLLRRVSAPVALVGLVLSGAPLVGGSAAAAATPPPAFQPTSSTPIAQGAVMYGNDAITATFDQPVTGSANSMRVYERNADGTRGYRLPGSVAFSCSTISGPGKSVTWTPSSTLVNGDYEVVVAATGTKSSSDCTADTSRPATADYDYFVVGTVKPTGLSATNPVNNQNVKAAAFNGTLAPGLSVKVTVPDSRAGGSGVNAASGSTVVPACGSSACPWTVKLDLSNLPDGQLAWTAQATDSVQTSKSTAAVAGPAFTKDTSAPSAPTFPSGSPSLAAKSVSLTVPQATDSASDLASFLITVSDPDGHSISNSVPASGQNMPAQTVDVSSLDDGTLTVAVQAVDKSGNISSPCCSDQFGQQSTPTVTKSTGLLPNLTASTVSTPAGDTSLAEAATHGVQTPKSIDVEFTQPIKDSYTNVNDASPSNTNGTHSWNAELTTPDGNTLMSLDMAKSSTGRGAVLTAPKGSAFPTAGAFGIRITVFSQNLCPNVTTIGAQDNCQSFSDQVRTGAQNTGPNLQITVDNVPPTIAFDATNPITADNLQTASLSGTVDSDVSAVQLTLTSSNAPSRPRVASLQTSTANGTTTFAQSPLPLSGMVDGTLTIVAKATDAAGNTSTVSKDIVLDALALTLVPGDGKLLATWTKPALVNGEAPNYTLYFRDQSVPNATVQSVSPASTATSQVIGGLTNGHDYGIVLTASDSVGDGPIAVGDAVPRGAARLSFAAPSRLTYGTTTILKGRLTHGSAGISHATITITPFYGSKAAKALQVTTDSTGAYALRARPLKTVTYVATFAGNSAYAPASAKRRVGLRVNIRITKVSGSKLYGAVAPNMHGRTVTIYERVGKKNKKIGTARLSSKSTWTFRHTWPHGKHYVFAGFATQNAYYGNNSSKVTITR